MTLAESENANKLLGSLNISLGQILKYIFQTLLLFL
jgi:hypothetical protein